MSRNRNRRPQAKKPMPEKDVLETAQAFHDLAVEMHSEAEAIIEATQLAYLEAVQELRLTKESELAWAARHPALSGTASWPPSEQELDAP